MWESMPYLIKKIIYGIRAITNWISQWSGTANISNILVLCMKLRNITDTKQQFLAKSCKNLINLLPKSAGLADYKLFWKESDIS